MSESGERCRSKRGRDDGGGSGGWEEPENGREITPGDLRRVGRLDARGRTWPSRKTCLCVRVPPPNLPVGDGLLSCGVAARRKVLEFILLRGGTQLLGESELVRSCFFNFLEWWEGVGNMKTGGYGAAWHQGIGT